MSAFQRGDWRASWGQGVAEGGDVERRSTMEGGGGEWGLDGGLMGAVGGGGGALSLLLVTPSQLHGFMERFLSCCCLLIDIKMH